MVKAEFYILAKQRKVLKRDICLRLEGFRRQKQIQSNITLCLRNTDQLKLHIVILKVLEKQLLWQRDSFYGGTFKIIPSIHHLIIQKHQLELMF